MRGFDKVGVCILFAFALLAIAPPVLAQCQNGVCRVPARKPAKRATFAPQVHEDVSGWYPGKLMGFRRGR
jgi:DNA-binding transcriptional regulator YdaS (Cro superfamily)